MQSQVDCNRALNCHSVARGVVFQPPHHGDIRFYRHGRGDVPRNSPFYGFEEKERKLANNDATKN